MKPVVLCFSGHDPSGGAGIQADIEALVSHQCHPCSVITTLTEQNTSNVLELIPQTPENILSQARTLLMDFEVQAFKIGLLAHRDTAHAIHQILSEHPQIPVILDPVLAAGGGQQMSDQTLKDIIVKQLLPLTTILTPNSDEAATLASQQCMTVDQRGLDLLDKGCNYVLITGSHEDTPAVTNRMYHNRQCIESWTWDRLPESYHGSGCTLAASIAAMTAHGLEPMSAVTEAQEFTWNSLQHGFQPGKGQYIPNRMFWMQEN